MFPSSAPGGGGGVNIELFVNIFCVPVIIFAVILLVVKVEPNVTTPLNVAPLFTCNLLPIIVLAVLISKLAILPPLISVATN